MRPPEQVALDDEALAALPNTPAVVLIHLRHGEPYLVRTSMLRRRLLRLRGFRHLAERAEYWPTASRLESSLVLYAAARKHLPHRYGELIRFRKAAYVKLLLANEFPRFQVVQRVTGGEATYYGPFHSRAAAEEFEAQALDLFLIRHCQEDLAPSPSHPGCIYGEMNRCLRPCQQVVSASEYNDEVRRARGFLSSQGRTLLESIAHARERASELLEFEEAQRQHRRHEQVEAVLKLRDDLAADFDRLYGVAVVPSVATESVDLYAFAQGWWQTPVSFPLEAPDGRPVSMDQRLREALGTAAWRGSVLERNEHSALLAGWYYSSFRDGEWLPFDQANAVPYRKLVRAISRVAAVNTSPSPATPSDPPASS